VVTLAMMIRSWLQSKRDRNEMLEDFIAAFEYLKTHKECNGKVGVVGFALVEGLPT
jgi:carboxymethylenebutenolidase